MRREWRVHIDPETGAGYEQLEESVLDLTTILLRCGGVGAISPHRVETLNGTYEVESVLLKYDSYAPGLNQPPQAEEAEQSEDNGQRELVAVKSVEDAAEE